MKILLIALVFSFAYVSCHVQGNGHSNDKPAAAFKKDTAISKEYMDWDSVKINGHLPIISHFKNAKELLGKPDSMITPNYTDVSNSYNDEKFKYCYFKGVTFEKYNDTLVFRNIEFKKSSNWFMSYRGIKFDKETTIADIEKLFPMSLKNNSLSGTDMDKFLIITVRTAKPGIDNADNWVFTFEEKHDKLIKLEYWIDD
ncbi:MAG: hypothetical protein JSU01_19295 [Bacteroidetes bacterium]|nr:hypothetical protein [Bacteroidota bacterium]